MSNFKRKVDQASSREFMQSLIADGKGHMESQEGYPFNIYADRWVLNADLNSRISAEWLHETPDLAFQICVRKALGHMLKTRVSRSSTSGALKVFFQHSNGTLTKEALTSFVAYVRKEYTTDAYITTLKVFLEELVIIDAQYRTFYNHLEHIKLRPNNPSQMYDPRKGALSDTEQERLHQALKDHLTHLKANHHGESVSDVIAWRHFIHLRLTAISSRRPVSLYQLKWKDLHRTPNPQGSLAPESFAINMPMAKLGDAYRFRTNFEDTPYYIIPDMYDELIGYQAIYYPLFHTHLENCGILLNSEQRRAVESNLPILPHQKLFYAPFGDPQEVVEAVQGEGVHASPDALIHAMQDLFESFSLRSDRVANFNYGPIRQRHTLGTRLGLEGKSKEVIALALGQSTSVATTKYIDLDYRAIKHINETTAEGFAPIVEAYQGRLIPELTKQLDAVQTFGNEGLIDIGGCDQCKSCTKDRPFACYPCGTFRPLRDADHRAVLTEAKRRYDLHLKAGVIESNLASLKNCMKWIAYTIAACEHQSRQCIKEELEV